MKFATKFVIAVALSLAPLAVFAFDGNCQFEVPGIGDKVPVRAEGKVVSLSSQEAELVANMTGGSAVGYLLTFGIAGVTLNSSLKISGEKSATRITEKMPEFLDLIVPFGTSPGNVFSLVRLDAKGQSRTVQIGTMEGLNRIGIATERPDSGGNAVPMVMEKVADKCVWRNSQWVQYKARPAAPLEKGEYGFMIYRKIYDFAVD